MGFTPSQLASEVAVDPAGLGYGPLAAAGNLAGILPLLNGTATGRTTVAPVVSGHLLIWGAATGVRAKVQLAIAGFNPATATTQATAIYSICLAVHDLLTGGAAALDMTNPAIVGSGGMLDALTAAGILAASGPGSKADLIAYATAPVSRAAELWGADTAVSVRDLEIALNGAS